MPRPKLADRFVITLRGPGGVGYFTNTGNFDRNESLARHFPSMKAAEEKKRQLAIMKGWRVAEGLAVEPERIAD